jgi:hypothetical protein
MKGHMEVFQKMLGKDHKTRPDYFISKAPTISIFLLQLDSR